MIGKNEAKVLEGVAVGLFTDTRESIVAAAGVMDVVYQAIRKTVAGRELAHVKYLLKAYKQLVKDDPSITAAEGSIGQVCAVVNKILKDGGTLPGEYGQARRLAYPPKESQPRGPRSGGDSGEGGEGGDGEGTPEPVSAGPAVSGKLAELFGYLREMDAAGFDWSHAESAIRNAYAEYSIECSLARDAAESLDMADEA